MIYDFACLMCFSESNTVALYGERLEKGNGAMRIIDKLHSDLSIGEGEMINGGEAFIEELMGMSPINLPDDYLDFLTDISGTKEYSGMGFEIKDTSIEIVIWTAKWSISTNQSSYLKGLPNAWLIGDDIGDMVFFYGMGEEGIGIYMTDAGALFYSSAEKIADSLTDFLVNGTGIEMIKSYCG